MNGVAELIVIGFGIYLLGLCAMSITNRHAVDRYLKSFASSAKLHVWEQCIRIVVGSALVSLSDSMRHGVFFRWFGWILIGTSGVLLLLPWKQHQRFAHRVVPLALRYRFVYMGGAAILGVWILWSTLTNEG